MCMRYVWDVPYACHVVFFRINYNARSTQGKFKQATMLFTHWIINDRVRPPTAQLVPLFVNSKHTGPYSSCSGLLFFSRGILRLSVMSFRSYLSEQEGDGSEGKRPAVLVAEVGLVGFGSVQHFVVNVGDVQHQSHHQRETCEMEGNLKVLQKSTKTCGWYMIEAILRTVRS